MDKEKDNSNIEEKVTISDLAEKAATKEPELKPKKRIGLGIMLTVLVLLLVGGALALGYLWGNNSSSGEATSSQPKGDDSAQIVDNTKSQMEEITATEDIQAALLGKLKILHSAVWTSGQDSYKDNIITRTTSYSYIPSLYDGSLSDSMKVSLVLDSLELQPANDTSFAVDFLKASPVEYRRKAAESDEIIKNIAVISYEDFSNTYEQLFGESHNSLEREYDTPSCRMMIYDPNGKNFYRIPIGGCGGSGLPVDFAYIEKYTTNDDLAYVYVNRAHMTFTKDQQGANLYEDDDMLELVAQLEFNDPGSFASMPFAYITEHASDFPFYRFDFKKDQNGNYYFKGIEKL